MERPETCYVFVSVSRYLYSANLVVSLKAGFSLEHMHKHDASEDSSNISIDLSTKHKKSKRTCFSYVVHTRNHCDINISKSTRKKKSAPLLLCLCLRLCRGDS